MAAALSPELVAAEPWCDQGGRLHSVPIATYPKPKHLRCTRPGCGLRFTLNQYGDGYLADPDRAPAEEPHPEDPDETAALFDPEEDGDG